MENAKKKISEEELDRVNGGIRTAAPGGYRMKYKCTKCNAIYTQASNDMKCIRCGEAIISYKPYQ
jgi:ribosomal protein S27E